MDPTPGQRRTAAATAARKQAKYTRMVAELRAAGYTVTPPLQQPPGTNECHCEPTDPRYLETQDGAHR